MNAAKPHPTAQEVAPSWSAELALPARPETGSSSLARRSLARLGGIDYPEVKKLVTIEQVLELLGCQPTGGRGAQLRGPCPIHGSTTPRSRSLSINLDRSLFRCFSCDAHGNQLDLYMAVTGLPLVAACEELCGKLGLTVPRLPNLGQSSGKRGNQPLTSSFRKELTLSSAKSRPIHELRLGRIKGLVWANPRGEEGTSYSVQIEKLYKSGDSWESTSSFSKEDLPLVSMVAERLCSYLYELRQESPAKEAPA